MCPWYIEQSTNEIGNSFLSRQERLLSQAACSENNEDWCMKQLFWKEEQKVAL
jgi:hypothetical protein